MQFHSWLIDRKILAINVSIDMPLGDYAELPRGVGGAAHTGHRQTDSGDRRLARPCPCGFGSEPYNQQCSGAAVSNQPTGLLTVVRRRMTR
jgi:hypothetical protein